MLWDILQQYQIGEAQRTASEAARAARAASRAQETHADLRQSIETLVLANQAMWEPLRERDGLTDGMLLARMHEIDARDGHVDGRITATIATCPSCARVTGGRTGRCVYCGTELPKQPSPFAGR